jgi:hypothetical protein
MKIAFAVKNNALFSRAQALGMTLEEESDHSPPNVGNFFFLFSYSTK